MQFAIAPPPQATFATPAGPGTGVAPQFAISPDGRGVVFVAGGDMGFQLWHRPLGAVEARALPGTEGAAFPFWAPDGRSVGFFAGAKLKTIRVDGGPAMTLCDAASGRGGTWNRDNVIVFAPATTGALQRVAAGGGPPQPVSMLDTEYGEMNHRFPFFLPDGKHFLYTATIGSCCPPAIPGRLKVGVLDDLKSETIGQVESSAVFADGHVLFAEAPAGTLMARRFNDRTRQFLGDAVAVAGEVAIEGSRYASVSASANGILAYARGQSRLTSRLIWFDRSGRQLGTPGEVGTIVQVSLASDDRHAAVASIDQTGNRDIWVLDTVAGTQSRASFDAAEDDSPIWFPNRQDILFVGRRPGPAAPLGRLWTILHKAVATATKEETVFTSPLGLSVTDVSTDGTLILFEQAAALGAATDVWVLRNGEKAPTQYQQTPASEGEATFSPDGKWIAYQSTNQGQRPQVYVQPYPATGAPFQISRDTGFKPLWRSNGKELFFLTDDRLMAVTIDTANGFHAGSPQPLFPVVINGRGLARGRQYGVTRDGQRFLIDVPPNEVVGQALTVTTDWLVAIQR